MAILSSSRQQPLWAGVLPVALTGNPSPGSADGRLESWGNRFPTGSRVVFGPQTALTPVGFGASENPHSGRRGFLVADGRGKCFLVIKRCALFPFQ